MLSQYIKSPLNFTGGKYKLLPQIIPLFPKDIDTFYDIFCGGCNVAINVEANKIVCNDIITPLINFYKAIFLLPYKDYLMEQIDSTINAYQLSETNEEGYFKLREDYNKGSRNWNMFFMLVAHSFCNQIRFNKSKGEFNLSFGDRTFNEKMRENFIQFVDKLNKINNIKFTNEGFRELVKHQLLSDDLVYCDPPYLITTATYNENGGWTEKDEMDLYNLLDWVDKEGSRFALSNVLESKGKTNHILEKWSKKYNIHYLNHNYKNCNYQRKDKNNDMEVLITNY